MSPIEDDDLIEASPPSAPSGLEVTEIQATAVTLKWKEPGKDGGAPIKEYIIEFKGAQDEEWKEVEARTKPKKYLTESVGELTTGQKYQFRVSAVNRIGVSDASDVTEPKLIKASKAPPTINRTGFPEGVVNCKVNSQLVLEVPIDGVPAPTTAWYQNDSELLTRDGLKVVHNPGMAKLMFLPATRALSGTYLIKAKNQFGDDSAEIQINVIGKPAMPSGPLNVSEVTKKSCLLAWKPPADNGGYQITHYEVEKMDMSIGSWLPVKSVKSMSLEVNNLVEGRAYKFLVRAVNQLGDSPDLETEQEIIAKNPFDPPSPPSKPNVQDWGEDWAELSWKPSEEDGGAEISGYKVEVRNRDRRAWNVAGTAGGSESSYRVAKHMSAGNDYEFRVIALNRGGESEPSPVSNTIHAMIRFIKPKINRDVFPSDKTVHATQTLRIEAEVLAEPAPKVIWSFPDGKSVVDSDPARCSVEYDDGIATLTIKEITRADAGNYHVVVKNSVGFDEMEVRVDVLAPPLAPKGFLEISGVTPTSCHLTWKMPEDNGGSPILGYTIEKKDVERDTWVACGKIASKTMAVMKMIEFDVSGLIPYFVYMFRVSAFNAQGDGEALETKVPMMAKSALDPPEPPATPRVVNYDKTYVELEWWAPSESNIKHYIIEAQETFLVPKEAEVEPEEAPEQPQEKNEHDEAMAPSNPALAAALAKANEQKGPGFTGEFEEYCSTWMSVMVTDDNTPAVKIKDLSEGHTYMFRVKAVNAAGPSYPSLPTEEIVCKLKKLRPIIDKSQLSQIKVSKNQTITLAAKVQGEPAPDKAWFYGRIEIKPCPSVEIIEKEHSIKLVMHGARRDDTGIYTLKADNDHGQDQADVEVIVMVEPSKPKGPMKIYDIYAEGCTAEWQPPEDDGGTPITQYIVEKVEGASVNWIACGRTNGDVTKCRITGLKPGKDHRLQVIAINAEGVSEPLECVDTFIPENPFGTPGAPGKPEQVGGDFDHFEMKWEGPRNDGGSRVLSYELEARLWRENNWFRVGEDKLLLNRLEARGPYEVGQHYAIRVRAINAAGAGPWSIDSDELVCKYKALKPKVTFKGVAAKEVVTFKAGETLAFEVAIEGEPPAHDIVWSLGGKDLNQAPGNGIIIDNGKEYKSSLVKENLSRRDVGSLICTATNMEGKASAGIEINVVGKPSMPQDRLLVSNITKTGCRLNWQLPKDDGGLPIEYIIEKYTQQSDSWTVHGTTTGTAYDVSDLEAGHEYGFAVKASNAVGDSDALPTAKMIMAKDQYTIPLPPGAPNVVDWSERHMDLAWSVPLDDGGAAITGYHIESKIRGEDEDWQLWETIDTNRTKASISKGIQKGKEYQFRLIAINKAGKSDPSHPSRPKEAQPKSLPPLIDAKNLHDVTVIAGDRVKFDLPFKGIPVPDIVWIKDGDEENPLLTTADKSIIITTTEDSTKLIINNVTKKHKGVYQCTISNSVGSDSAKGELKVLDRPEPPEGLTASVDGDKCVLMWKRSKDDGGAPIEHYQVERFELDRGCWMACGKSHGNTFDAKGLLKGREYKFRVSAVNEHGDSDPAEAKETIILSQKDDMDNAVRNF